jgi:hypothetical protein
VKERRQPGRHEPEDLITLTPKFLLSVNFSDAESLSISGGGYIPYRILPIGEETPLGVGGSHTVHSRASPYPNLRQLWKAFLQTCNETVMSGIDFPQPLFATSASSQFQSEVLVGFIVDMSSIPVFGEGPLVENE